MTSMWPFTLVFFFASAIILSLVCQWHLWPARLDYQSSVFLNGQATKRVTGKVARLHQQQARAAASIRPTDLRKYHRSILSQLERMRKRERKRKSLVSLFGSCNFPSMQMLEKEWQRKFRNIIHCLWPRCLLLLLLLVLLMTVCVTLNHHDMEVISPMHL